MSTMEWVLWMAAAAVLGLAALAGSGRLGEMPDTVSDTPRPHLPEGDLTAEDLRDVQFAVVTRGYSMTQVDELLDRLARQIEGGEPDLTRGISSEPAGSGIIDAFPEL